MERSKETPDANTTRIAGEKTCEDWKEFIQKEKSEDFWQEAYNDYFFERLKTRYLNPITAIESLSIFKGEKEEEKEEEKRERKSVGNGEGFSIMAILCTLVEFLEATRQGKEYRQLIRENYTFAQQGRFDLINPPFDPNNQYYKSKEYFINFLRHQKPFDVFFPNDMAEIFYEFVRCGLLHEAQTKEGWKIKIAGKKSSNKALIDAEERIVYRDNFREAFDTYLKIYEEELKTDINLQNALINKFNSLCKK